MLSKRFYGAALMAAILVPVSLAGCSSDSPLCCSEFKAGATLDAKIGGNAQAQVAVQAVADFAGIASAAIDDLTTACRGMAQDLDADTAKQDAAEANADKSARMTAWCTLAAEAIGTLKAKASFTLEAAAPKCSASISAKANCQAKCSGSAGKCDFKANPPKCTGGTLEVSCKGGCTASGGVSVKCEGSCTAECTGSCTAEAGGVDCTGKCEGTCEAKAGVGTGTGAQADGTCNGTCKGTCAVVAPKATCKGSCKGSCSAKCEGTADVAVKCDGTCDGAVEPLKCEGGKLEGGCTPPDVKCDGNCDASVSAKAECTPPTIVLKFSAGVDAQAAGKLKAALEANLGVVLAFKSRLEGMAKLTGTIAGNADAVVSIKAACIPQVVAAAAAAGTDVTAAVGATVKIGTAVGS